MQFEADMVGAPVERTTVAELSAMGAAQLAGVSAGLFTLEELTRLDRGVERFAPGMTREARAKERRQWARAVTRREASPCIPKSRRRNEPAGYNQSGNSVTISASKNELNEPKR